jgi:hypothetical protein
MLRKRRRRFQAVKCQGNMCREKRKKRERRRKKKARVCVSRGCQEKKEFSFKDVGKTRNGKMSRGNRFLCLLFWCARGGGPGDDHDFFLCARLRGKLERRGVEKNQRERNKKRGIEREVKRGRNIPVEREERKNAAYGGGLSPEVSELIYHTATR